MDRRHVTGKKPVSSSSARGASGQGRLNYLSHDQGPSSFDGNFNYDRGGRARYRNHELDGQSRFENLENSRAELIWKIDELKEQLSLSCEVAEKPGRRMGTDMMISPARNETYPRNRAAYVQEGLTDSHGVNKPGFAPYPHTYRSSLRNLHSQRGFPHELPSDLDAYQQEMPRGPYYRPHQHHHDCSNGYYGNVNHDLFVVNRNFREHTCSCVHYFDKNWDAPVNPSYLYNQRSRQVPSNPNYLRHPLPIDHRPHGLSSGGFSLQMSNSQQSRTATSIELDSGNDEIHQNCSRKKEEASWKGRMLHPVRGGAPIISCSSCFELLKLPRKHISLKKQQHKLRCGACSTIILFEFDNKALTLLVSGSLDVAGTEMDDCSSVAVDKNVGYQQGNSNIADPDAFSDSNAESLPKVSPADNKSNSSEFEKKLDPLSPFSPSKQMPSTPSPEKHGTPSAKLQSAEVESFPHPILSSVECPDLSANVVVDKCDSGDRGTKSEFNHNLSWQNSGKDSAVSTDIDMSSKEFPKTFVLLDSVDEIKEQHLGDDKCDPGDRGTKSEFNDNLSWQNSGKDSAVSTDIDMSSKEFPKTFVSLDSVDEIKEQHLGDDKCDSGDRGTKYEFNHNLSWQNSGRDSAVSTDIDMSSKEFPKTFVSLDSVNEIKEEHLGDDKGAESSSAGHVKNRLADFINLVENVEVGSSQVFVNRHLIPERLVQKAELLAGPIQPGDYWYDIRAGFWGVMGYPCLGIIMPNIEEFNYPMPVKCSSGNTGVFVNGRELHQKDLDLLAGRGLPETRQISYLIEISGEVVDADTGEELNNIGKLAPTVERAKHGFGMKVPSFIARLQG